MNKVEFQNQVKITNPAGGCLNGYLIITYAKLVELLGPPNVQTDEYKTDAEWAVSFQGETFAIYNYKTGKNYLGAEGLDVEDITTWHIGGDNKNKAAMLIALFDSVE